MVAMCVPAEGRVLNFLGGGDKACLHCTDSTLLTGSQWRTHISSPVTICCTNLTGSDSKTSTISSSVALQNKDPLKDLLKDQEKDFSYKDQDKDQD